MSLRRCIFTTAVTILVNVFFTSMSLVFGEANKQQYKSPDTNLSCPDKDREKSVLPRLKVLSDWLTAMKDIQGADPSVSRDADALKWYAVYGSPYQRAAAFSKVCKAPSVSEDWLRSKISEESDPRARGMMKVQLLLRSAKTSSEDCVLLSALDSKEDCQMPQHIMAMKYLFTTGSGIREENGLSKNAKTILRRAENKTAFGCLQNLRGREYPDERTEIEDLLNKLMPGDSGNSTHRMNIQARILRLTEIGENVIPVAKDRLYGIIENSDMSQSNIKACLHFIVLLKSIGGEKSLVVLTSLLQSDACKRLSATKESVDLEYPLREAILWVQSGVPYPYPDVVMGLFLEEWELDEYVLPSSRPVIDRRHSDGGK